MGANVKEIIASYDPNRPFSEASTPPTSWYIEPQVLALEQRTVFSRSWQLAGRSDQVRSSGQYLTGDVASNVAISVSQMTRRTDQLIKKSPIFPDEHEPRPTGSSR